MMKAPSWSTSFVLVAAVFSSVPSGAASAQGAPGREADAAEIRAKVQACFSPQPGATRDAVVAFRIDEAGKVLGKPEIVERGDGPINETFAAAALRAVLRCSPYKAQSGPDIRIVFKASGSSDAAAPQLDGDRSGSDRKPTAAPQEFCDVDPRRGGYREMIWTKLMPPRERNVSVESLAIDCETLAAADAGRPGRPKRLYNVYRPLSLPADAPTSLAAFLSYFEARFSSAGNSVTRDDVAVYVAQKGNSSGGVNGISAYTLVAGNPVIVNMFDFTREWSPEKMQSDLSASVRLYR